jgi:hypothetical protein
VKTWRVLAAIVTVALLREADRLGSQGAAQRLAAIRHKRTADCAKQSHCSREGRAK